MTTSLIIHPGSHEVRVVEREGVNDPVETLISSPVSRTAFTLWNGKTITIEETGNTVPPRDGADFGWALAMMKAGFRVARRGWNGAGMFAYLVPAASYPVQTGAAKAHFGEGAMVPYRAYLALKTVDEDVATWAPSVSDLLADDWFFVT